MSIEKCKCGMVFDTDFDLGTDTYGNCICDDCYEELLESGAIVEEEIEVDDVNFKPVNIMVEE